MYEEELVEALKWALANGVHGAVVREIGNPDPDGIVLFTAHDGTCDRDIEPPDEIAAFLEDFVRGAFED